MMRPVDIYRRRVISVIGAGLVAIGILLMVLRFELVLFFLSELLRGLPLILLCLGGWLLFKAYSLGIKDLGRFARPKKKKSLDVTCPRCGYASPLGTKFCSRCGSPLPQPMVCSNCQKLNTPEARFCAYCGQRLIEKAETTEL